MHRFRFLHWIGCGLCVVGMSLFSPNASGQDSYELSVQGLAAPSVATLNEHELAIRDPAGTVTRYQRNPRYDTTDQQFLGYSSRQAQQVLRWPASNSGKMQLGTLQGANIHFAWSKMSIAPSTGKSDSGAPAALPNGTSDLLPPAPEDAPLGIPGQQGNGINDAGGLPQAALVSLGIGSESERQFLSLNASGNIAFAPTANAAASSWYIAPVANNIVRLQQSRNHVWHALGCDEVLPNINHGNVGLGNGFGNNVFPPGGAFGNSGFGAGIGSQIPVSLFPINNHANQLWRIHTPPGLGGGYYFESVLYPGMGLTMVPNGGLFLSPVAYLPTQIWWPQRPIFQPPPPQFRTINHQVVPNPPLPSVNARVTNSHSDTIVVLLADRRDSQQTQKIRIPAGRSEMVRLDRDAGATIVETVETLDAFGNWNRQQFKTPVPPAVLYDMSVYEEFLQSIAIDRTGKSPNPIEDINYQPRSIGFFLLPPGAQLPEYAEIDAFRRAQDAQNPGAVRRINPRDLIQNPAGKNPAPDPLKELLNQFQKQRAAF